MSRRSWWRLSFLGLTTVVLGMEVFASADGDPTTDPWTDLIVAYIPGELTGLAVAGLSGWLAIHFGLRYWRKRKAASADE